MKNILKILSLVALALTIVPAVLVFNGSIEMSQHYNLMFAGTVIWFATTPFWMSSEEEA